MTDLATVSEATARRAVFDYASTKAEAWTLFVTGRSPLRQNLPPDSDRVDQPVRGAGTSAAMRERADALVIEIQRKISEAPGLRRRWLDFGS
jgi:hypothetical protein